MFSFVLYFFQFYISSLWGGNILPNLTNSQESEPEPHVFGPLEPQPEPLKKNTRSRSRLGKKSGPGAAWKKKLRSRSRKNKLSGSPTLHITLPNICLPSFRRLCGQMSESVSQSVSRPRVDVKASVRSLIS